DVNAVLQEARSQGRPAIALTNDPTSPLARAAGEVLPLEAGPEHAVAATKTYLNSLGAIALLFVASTEDATAQAELERVPSQVAEQLEQSLAGAAALDAYAGIEG